MSCEGSGNLLDPRHAALHLGSTLRMLRLDRGLTQEQVAQVAGIATYTYGCLERGRSPSGGWANPTLTTLLRVLIALGVEPPSLTQ